MDVYDHDETSDPDLIGSSETCVNQLREAVDQQVFIEKPLDSQQSYAIDQDKVHIASV